ncbi:MAG TPA: hypothetical protein VII56_03665 [Rhizomicrobium sp.]
MAEEEDAGNKDKRTSGNGDERALTRVRREFNQRRLTAARIALAATVLLFAISVVSFAGELASLTVTHHNYDGPSDFESRLSEVTAVIRIFGILSIIATFGFGTFLYVSGYSIGEVRRASAQSLREADLTTLAAIADSVRTSAEQIQKNRLLTEAERTSIAAELAETVRASISTEFLKSLDEKYGTAIRNEKVSDLIENRWSKIEDRLLGFQKDISRQAAAAQAWGLGVGAGGLAVLVYFFWAGVHPSDTGMFGEIFHYTARLSLVAVIEGVAFFFLRLFRNTLNDAKYINNELTNARFRLLALLMSTKLDSGDTTGKILLNFSQTERNFALKDGEVSALRAESGAALPAGELLDLLGKVTSIVKGSGSS